MSKVLWTGGFDSTFAVLQYLHWGFEVEPYYLVWGGVHHDLELNVISNHIKSIKKLHFGSNLKDLTIINFPLESKNLEWFPEDLVKAYLHIFVDVLQTPVFALRSNRTYEHLRFASLPADFDGISLGIPNDNRGYSATRKLFDTIGHLKADNIGVGYLPKDECDPSFYRIYGRFKFPVIFKTEPEMLTELENWGYYDIIKNTRFCKHHNIYKDGPCGTCFPCQIKYGYGMYEFFNLNSWKRAEVFHQLSLKYGKTDKFFIFPAFKRFCAGKFSGKDYSYYDISAIYDVPLNFAHEFSRLINNCSPSEEVVSRLGKYFVG